jgi:hypothetical protein
LEVDSAAVNQRKVKSPYRGVYETYWGGTWYALVQHKGEKHYLGTFITPEEARDAYLEAKAALTG